MALIYVVEDDVNIREIECFALKNSGYTIEDFECAKDFYLKVRERVPDLVLLDIMLPDEDGVMELISRTKALLRRSQNMSEEKFLTLGDIVLDDEKRMVCINEKPCDLTYKEFELLKMLLQNAGIVIPREEIMVRVWGMDYEGESRTLDMHIKTLRQKLGESGSLMKTVRNVGYLME